MAKTPCVLIIGAASTARSMCETLLRRKRFRARTVEPYDRELRDRHPSQPELCIAVCDNLLTATHEIQLYRELWGHVPLLAVDATPGSRLTVPLLEAGADDVLSPSSVGVQLVPRVRALLRRQEIGKSAPSPVPLVAGDLRIDLNAHKVWSGSQEVALSPTEFRILQKLCMHAGRVVPHREILIAAWGEHRPELVEGLRVYIRHIRLKVQAAGEAVTIVSRPGIGYMLSVVG